MDEFNNTPNPFDEENGMKNTDGVQPDPNERQTGQFDPYNQPPQQNGGQYNPYQMPPQNGGQYNPYNLPPQQNGQYNPYNQPPQQNSGQYNPYQMPQNGQQYNPYEQPQQGGYQYPNYAQFGQYPYGAPYAQKPSTGMAVASMVLGIISLVLGIFMFTFVPLLLIPIIGIVLGIVFKSKRLPVGKGLSTAGIIMCSLALVLSFVLLVVISVWLLSDSGSEVMRNYLDWIKSVSPKDYEDLYKQYGDQFPKWFSEAARLFFGF